MSQQHQPIYSVQITAIYTSPDGARQVRQMLSRINSDMTHGIQFQLRLWRADVLHMPDVYALARNDAASSMLLMLICEGQSQICPEVETITDEWCETHAESEAALALLCDHTLDSPIVVTFQHMAERHRLDFLFSKTAADMERRFQNPSRRTDDATHSQA